MGFDTYSMSDMLRNKLGTGGHIMTPDTFCNCVGALPIESSGILKRGELMIREGACFLTMKVLNPLA